MTHIEKIASEINLKQNQIDNTISLLDDGATVPFIARYRKEVTGSIDEVQITTIRDRILQLRDLDKRREAILKSLTERELLTDELQEKITAAETMTELEDIYLPYKPKRRTRGTIAKEKGLEPLAEKIFLQEDFNVQEEAEKYIDPEKEVNSIDEALAGARDIIAEWVNEDADARAQMRELFTREAVYKSAVIPGKEIDGVKFVDYYEWEEAVKNAPSHRVLALRRGEKEGILNLKIIVPEESAFLLLEELFIESDNEVVEQMELAIVDSYKRLLAPSMETEIRQMSKDLADEEAVTVFANNLRQLLLAAPFGQKIILAIDPGYRTGCKVACLDRQGKLVHHTTIFPFKSDYEKSQAEKIITNLSNQFKIEAIAIGNGTASRETEAFVKSLPLSDDLQIVMVDESGASVYSASEIARQEFPDHDVTVRGTVSIGRRLLDPLSELVKIDPKAIGVGQYQHDVDQSALKNRLDDVVISCVNSVGVEINTASRELLTYVSGLGPQLAKTIIEYRNEHGPFKARKQLLKVARLGPKAFEQSAGFLRIREGSNPLDASAVHPESYSVVEKMAADLGCAVSHLIQDKEMLEKIDLSQYVSADIGMPTLVDIKSELAKPGLDPREKYELFSFAKDINKFEDVEEGMIIPGIITNVTNFGAFVDIGVHQDGLVHISELSDGYVKDPTEHVKVHQKVKVTVLKVDPDRKRIALSLRQKEK